ncbi:hypothetical protein DOTSEDRAFT_75175 [Dothistroma septosporum NZE10]|uniref:Vacuolar import and degradation protein 21 n=1 Tax=Dothistroma septosporum (strain NZE10 / CBS 128990) TaxID=675120 RepID=M2Y261_DOTSN|nr:hypothetical protein DOTSEDRAFT_75175 [Dothistroma septosporum NZE10]
MSLVDNLRRDILTTKQHELTALRRAHATDLLALFRAHNTVAGSVSIDTFLGDPIDLNHVAEDEAALLKQSDLSNGQSFDISQLVLLPPPPATAAPSQQDASIQTAKPSSVPAKPSGRDQSPVSADEGAATGSAGPQALNPTNTTPGVPVAGQVGTETPSVATSLAPRSTHASRSASVVPDDRDVAPAKVAPPQPEEQANLSNSAQELVDADLPSKPAKVIHLPSEEVQEHRLHERERELERRRQSEAESKSSQRLAAPPNELASSPSSTVGPYSASTPRPPEESPDTSPESEGEQVEVPPPKDLQPSAEEQQAKEEHDRILEAQKEIARKQALGDVAETPDEQLRWEEREAAAREAEERAAREAISGPEPDHKDGRDPTEAEQAVAEMETDAKPQQERPLETTRDNASSETQVKTFAIQRSATEDDGDTIAVARRKTSQPAVEPLQPAETPATIEQPSAKTTSTISAPPRRGGMTTRVSSGAMRQKSVSEILGQSPPPEHSQSLRKETSSSAPVSPMSIRQSQDNAATPAMPPQPQATLPHRTTSMPTSALEQLQTLKGASEDPERDYLESLFRIQAHEAQNSGTRTLGDLIKMVPKALSTEDHFTAIHERLDFRMLRRIYQLQNANKWSLRQMEKVKEPEQSVSHHDHMLQEMKWMRKDFKAERKMKKSICAWLAQRCAEWVNADSEQRSRLQVKPKAQQSVKAELATDVPDLEQGGDSAPEDDISPPTPRSITPLPRSLVVAPELADAVEGLQKSGKLPKALAALPKTGFLDRELKHEPQPLTSVSKFVAGKILPKAPAPPRKRSRYDYEDEAEVVDAEPASKRPREADHYPSEDVECALFHPDNKPIRDRLHSNNAFRPPSEFIMPTTSFYEYRSGSQWIWEDDQKLRKLAKEYSFNWSLIADEMALPTRHKSSAERRTPWECFERWVELESLPADMRKTVYFKTWFQRLEQSQQAAERRYQAQVAHIQQQAAQSGGPTHIPPRRRTTPTRVEKRRAARYLWMVDGFRKLAKRREQAAWKQAENARAAAQRKSQTEGQPAQKMVKMTPQEFSKKRHERDLQILEAQKQHRQKIMEAQQRQIAAARAQAVAAQQGGLLNGIPPQQRGTSQGQAPQHAQMPNGQPQPNGVQNTAQQQARMQMAPQRNGHLAPPQVNAQGIPQAQMQARGGMAPPSNMQQLGAASAQGRNQQFANQQQYSMQNGNMSSPGGTAMTTAQQLQQNQALLQAYHQQQQANGAQAHNMNHTNSIPQLSGSSPSMPPPPTPQSIPQQLSSGHVPQIIAIQNQIRAQNPGISEDNLKLMATQQMTKLSQSSQARQTAINAAAGLSSPSSNAVQAHYPNNQAAYQRNGQMANGQSSNNINGTYANGGDSAPQANMSPSANSTSPSQQQLYAQNLQYQQRKLMQQQMQSHSPHGSHAQLSGSPSVNHASPSMAPASPSLQYSNMNQTNAPMAGMNSQRPSSRSNTPQMQRIGSSGSGVAIGNGVQSPGSQLQGSPRNMQASMAR